MKKHLIALTMLAQCSLLAMDNTIKNPMVDEQSFALEKPKPEHKALYDKDIKKSELEKLQENINITDAYKRTTLHIAAALGFKKFSNLYWSSNAMNSRIFLEKDFFERTLQHYAAKNGSTNILKETLQELNPDQQDVFGQNCLHIASWFGNTDFVQTLSTHRKIDFNQQDKNGRTALHLASYKGFLPIVETLLQRGANIAIKDNDDNYPLAYAQLQNHQEIIRLLQRKSAIISELQRSRTPEINELIERTGIIYEKRIYDWFDPVFKANKFFDDLLYHAFALSCDTYIKDSGTQTTQVRNNKGCTRYELQGEIKLHSLLGPAKIVRGIFALAFDDKDICYHRGFEQCKNQNFPLSLKEEIEKENFTLQHDDFPSLSSEDSGTKKPNINLSNSLEKILIQKAEYVEIRDSMLNATITLKLK